MKELKVDRIGEINYNNFGSKMEIIAYRRCDDIDVYFEEYNWIFKNTVYQRFKKGAIACPYEPTVYKVGYLGEGKYKCRENNKDTKCYKTWHGMMERCYDKERISKRPTYEDCTVCEEWHNFQSFAKWYYKHYYEIEGQRMCLDKDILIKGNKIYSPSTCIIVPEKINILFVKCNKSRGEYPIGVSYHSKGNNLRVRCNDKNNKTIVIGYFPLNKPFQAFDCYKNFKENTIKQVADEYKGLIPNQLYEAMYKWKVNIND